MSVFRNNVLRITRSIKLYNIVFSKNHPTDTDDEIHYSIDGGIRVVFKVENKLSYFYFVKTDLVNMITLTSEKHVMTDIDFDVYFSKFKNYIQYYEKQIN